MSTLPPLPNGAVLEDEGPALPPGAKADTGASAPTPASPKGPTANFYTRAMSGIGLPANKEELTAVGQALLPQNKVEQVFAAASPVMPLVAHVAKNYVSNLLQKGKGAAREIGEAARNISEGGPILANIGKAGAGLEEFQLKGMAAPVGGEAVHNFGEDIFSKNWGAAGGDAAAVLVQALLMKGAKPLGKTGKVNKMTFAGDLPETMSASKDVAAVVPDIDKAIKATGKAPKTVGELVDVVNTAKDAMNAESGAAMQQIAGQKIVPMGIADRIRAKITPDMAKTPAGRRMAKALVDEAAHYQKPWSYRELDAARMNANARLNSFFGKAQGAQYANLKTDVGTIVDSAIKDGVREEVYPAMDKAAGKPVGYFENLKSRQGTLIQMEEHLTKQAKALSTKAAKKAGAPRLGSESVAVYGHTSGVPSGTIRRLQDVIHRVNPEKVANKAVTRAFNGRPTAKAALYSLPIRELILSPNAPTRMPEEQSPE